MSYGMPRGNKRLIALLLAGFAAMIAGLLARSPGMRRLIAERGRPPRVDDSLLERKVVTELSRIPGEADLSEVEIGVHDGAVTLTGAVGTIHLIRQAEAAVRSLPEVRRLSIELTARQEEEAEGADGGHAAAGLGEGRKADRALGR